MKKLVVIILSLAMAFSVVGCKKENKDEYKAIDLFEDMNENLAELDNMSIMGTLELELEQLNIFADPFIIEMNGELSSREKIKLNLGMTLGMFPLEAEIYITQERWLIYSELVGSLLGAPYMSFDLQETISNLIGTTGNGIDFDILKSAFKRYKDESEFDIYDIINIEDKITDKKISVNNEKIETQHIKMDITLDSIEEIFYDFMAFALDDEASRKLLLDYMTEEQIMEMKAEVANPDNRQELQSLLEGLDINIFQVDLYLNEDLKPVRIEIDLDATLEYEDETNDFKLKLNLEMFNFDDVEDVIIPEVNPSDVEDIIELLSTFF